MVTWKSVCVTCMKRSSASKLALNKVRDDVFTKYLGKSDQVVSVLNGINLGPLPLKIHSERAHYQAINGRTHI